MTPERGQGSESSDIMAGVCEQWDELQTLIALINASADNPDASTNPERKNYPLIYEIQGHPALVGSAVDALRQAFPEAARVSYEGGKDETNLFGWTPLGLLQKIEAGLLRVIADPRDDESIPSSHEDNRHACEDSVVDAAKRIIGLLEYIKDGCGVAPVIILEDYDRIPEGLRKVIEDQLLGPVAADRSAVVVITNGRISYDRTDIRRTTSTRLFNGVEKPEELFPEISSEIDTDLLQQITGGFPDAIAYVYNKASKEGVLRDADKFNKLLKEIAEDDDFTEWVIEEIMGRDGDKRELITMLVLMRRFNWSIVKSYYMNTQKPEESMNDRDMVIWRERMGRNVVLSGSDGRYSIDPRIAGMISAYTDHHHEHAIELHDRAANLYLGLIYDSKSPAIQYVVEYLYHQLAIIRIEQDGTGEDAQVERQMIELISNVVSELEPDRNQFSKLMTYDPDLCFYWSAYAKSLKQN